MTNCRKTKVDGLIRLANDPGATPAERATATRKLEQIIHDRPESLEYQPLKEFTTRDFVAMKRADIPTGGSWTGRNLEEALALMIADYQERATRYRNRPRMLTNPFARFRVNRKKCLHKLTTSANVP